MKKVQFLGAMVCFFTTLSAYSCIDTAFSEAADVEVLYQEELRSIDNKAALEAVIVDKVLNMSYVIDTFCCPSCNKNVAYHGYYLKELETAIAYLDGLKRTKKAIHGLERLASSLERIMACAKNIDSLRSLQCIRRAVVS